jgi:gamma-glutamyl-gamma-aminobutyrate hydrolase PuuD
VPSVGGTPVILPVGGDVESLLARIDGLILIGGPDVDPARYGEDRHPKTQPARDDRDGFELALALGAMERELPLLAICRGLQVVNVARGGTLHQHLPEIVGHDGHAPSPGHYGQIEVDVVAGSKLEGILGASTATVECSHHQGISVPGADLTVSASAHDGVIEGVEDRSPFFVVGVQLHPEAGTDRGLFRALVAAGQAR